MAPKLGKQVKYGAGMLGVAALLMTAACSNVETSGKAAVAPAPPAADSKAKEAPPLRTEQVFDQNKYKGLLTIRYFNLTGDVAEGDSILIQTPDGHKMLIDAGLAEVGPQVVQYLDKLGVSTLDIALNTHPHTDHIGGFASVAAAKEIKQFYAENFQYTESGAYNNAMKALQSKHVPIKYVERGDTFQLGPDVKIEVLNPPKGALPDAIKDFSAATINLYSIVLKMTYKNQTFLMTGDIYTDREQDLIGAFGSKLDADFLDIPHHGHPTSSSNSFIDAVSPQIAVASNNIFGHLDILKRYDQHKVKFYSTGLNGNILITSDGEHLNAITEKDWKPAAGFKLENQ